MKKTRLFSAPQTQKVYDLLADGERLTRLTAMHYGIMNLTARVSELRGAGVSVWCDMKKDHDGRRYGSFYMTGA